MENDKYIAHLELSERYKGVLYHTEQRDLIVDGFHHDKYFDVISFRMYINGNYKDPNELVVTLDCDICDSNNQFIMKATMNQKPRKREPMADVHSHRFSEVFADTYILNFKFLVPRQVKENKDED